MVYTRSVLTVLRWYIPVAPLPFADGSSATSHTHVKHSFFDCSGKAEMGIFQGSPVGLIPNWSLCMLDVVVSMIGSGVELEGQRWIIQGC